MIPLMADRSRLATERMSVSVVRVSARTVPKRVTFCALEGPLLVLIEADSEDEARRFVQERGLEGRVRFTGAVNNVDEYLKASDLYAFPTENEAFPLALLEAMACGLAAVTTTTGGLKDIVADATVVSKHNWCHVVDVDCQRASIALVSCRRMGCFHFCCRQVC